MQTVNTTVLLSILDRHGAHEDYLRLVYGG